MEGDYGGRGEGDYGGRLWSESGRVEEHGVSASTGQWSEYIVMSMCATCSCCIFTSRSARTAGTKIALRFPRLFVVCLFVCPFVCLSVCLCVRTYHVRNILRHALLCNCSVQ